MFFHTTIHPSTTLRKVLLAGMTLACSVPPPCQHQLEIQLHPVLYTAANPLSPAQRLLWKVEHAPRAKMSVLPAGGRLICIWKKRRPWQAGKAASVLWCNKKPPQSLSSPFGRCVSCSFEWTQSADFSAGKQQLMTPGDTCYREHM